MQILDLISEGHWHEGEQLPSEADLCRSLGVGRSTIREALTSLAFVGIVQMRAGEGTFVSVNSYKFLDQVLSHGFLHAKRDVTELAETRILLETELAGLCAQRATEQDLRALEEIVSTTKQYRQLGKEELSRLDVDFHLAIAKASQNRIMAELLRTIRGLLQAYVMKALQLPGSAALAYQQHLIIFKALKKHDPRKAREAMRNHLQTFQRSYAILARASESVGALTHGSEP